MHTTTTPAAPFTVGRLLITPGAQQILVTAGMDPFDLLARHVVGDWGAICAEDWKANDAARCTGDRLLSAYPLDPECPDGPRVWIITEANRSATTLLLPEAY